MSAASAKQAEPFALREALGWISRRNIHDVCVKLDAKSVVEEAQGKKKPDNQSRGS